MAQANRIYNEFATNDILTINGKVKMMGIDDFNKAIKKVSQEQRKACWDATINLIMNSKSLSNELTQSQITNLQDVILNTFVKE